MHGLAVLLYQGGNFWQLSLVLMTGLLGIWGLSGWRNFEQAIQIRASTILAITWILLLTTGGVGSFFLLWYFVLITLYPFILSSLPASMLLIGISSSYLVLVPLSSQTVPLIVVLSRVFLLLFIGGLMRAIGISTKRYFEEHKKTVERLRVSEARYRSLFEQSNDAVFILDLQGNHVSANQRAAHMLGYSEEEMRQLSFSETSAEQDESENNLQRLLAGESLPVYERLFRRKDGVIFPAEVNVELVRDMDNQPLHIMSVIRDISQRKQAEENLRQSEEKYRTLFEHLPIPVFTKNLKGEYTSCNAEHRKYWEVDPVGYTDADILDAETAAKFRETDQQVIESGQPVTVEEHFKSSPLGERHVLSLKVPLRNNNGEIDGLLDASLDITERKRLEEQLRLAQKMEAIGQLTAGIAHDFNNLLTTINFSAELIYLGLKQRDPLKEKVNRITDSCHHAANLIRQLMVFSRKQIVEPKVLDLSDAVEQISIMLRRIIGEHVDLVTELSSSLWPVKIDPTQVEQVIVNLAVNARDAMPDGGTIIIKTENVIGEDSFDGNQGHTKSGDYVLLSVADSGIGMSKEVKDRIFEPFFTTKEVGHGTGLGMATVYGIVRQNDGDILVDSVEDEGTTFRIYLPRVREIYSPATYYHATPEMATGSETILLVEDAEGVREMTLKMLQMQGYIVLEAQNGLDAMQLASKYLGPIHLLLTDVVMPMKSGITLAKQLTQSRPETKVLYMSGYSDRAIAHHRSGNSGVAFLQKPFGQSDLTRKIRQVLDSTAAEEV